MSKISDYLNKNGSDKCTRHTYDYVYDELFGKFDRNAPIDILESGIEYGPSLFTWKEYFPNAHVTGVDVVDHVWPEFRRDDVELVVSDIKEYKPNRKFDIIIEDGNHSNYDAIWAAVTLSEHLKDDGVLIIEDVQEGFTVPFLLWGQLQGPYTLSAIDMRRLTHSHDNFLIKIEKWRRRKPIK